MSLNKHVLLFLSTLVIVTGISGCSRFASTSVPTDLPEPVVTCSANEPATVQPALYGLWINEIDDHRSLLTITEKSVYLVIDASSATNEVILESFFEIDSIDWANGIISMKLRWVRDNGKYGGFDNPSKLMKVTIDDETLYFGLTDMGMELPTDLTNGPWVKK